MTTDTSRRALLGATAAALAGGAAVNLAAITIAKADLSPQGEKSDPIFALIEQHKALYDLIESTDWQAGEVPLDIQVGKLNAIADAILAMPVATCAGAAAAMRWMLDYDLSVHEFEDGLNGAFLRRVADAIERMGALS
jgi:hypothetical protein